MTTGRFSIADVAALIGEPTRAAILLLLLEGRERPAGELAREANLSAAATSLHLSKLTAARLLLVREQGRHRYYRLANADVAHALEALGVIATGPPPPRAISKERVALRAARSCYDHLAGELSLRLAEMLERDALVIARDDRNYDVTEAGAAFLKQVLAIDVRTLAPKSRRALASRCLDWTERRPHLAGALGAAFLTRFLEEKWLARMNDSRALRVTSRGELALAKLGIERIPN